MPAAVAMEGLLSPKSEAIRPSAEVVALSNGSVTHQRLHFDVEAQRYLLD